MNALSANPPSATSAMDLCAGRPGSLLTVTGCMLGRAAMIGLGLYAAGDRDRQVVKHALGAAAVTEASVLAWAQMQQQATTLPSAAAAAELLGGDIASGLGKSLIWTAARAAEIRAGTYLTGDRRRPGAWKRAAAGALVVQAFITAYALSKRGEVSAP